MSLTDFQKIGAEKGVPERESVRFKAAFIDSQECQYPTMLGSGVCCVCQKGELQLWPLVALRPFPPFSVLSPTWFLTL